jgi:NhaP-type Na+/H+ or K+/H+ antiporter
VLFIGWFGPRGLASIVLLLILLNEHPDIGGSLVIAQTVTLTVLMSVLAHGLSTEPLIAAYGRRLARRPPDAPEFGATSPALAEADILPRGRSPSLDRADDA